MPGAYCTTHRFTNCCFCLSLKTGCKIVGSLTAFICSLELVAACQKLIDLLEREKRCMENNVKWEEAENKAFFSICPHIKVVQFMLIIDFIKYVIGFNGSILLLYGIRTKQPKLFLAWLIFAGLVLFINFFTILIWHNMNVMSNLFVVIVLSYVFTVVRSYRLQLYEELNNGCPVVAVAFPQESGVRVFLPAQQPQTVSDYIKDDPPPPYPGLPAVASTASIDSQPPPYSVVNPTYDGPPIPTEPSSSSSHHAVHIPIEREIPIELEGSSQHQASGEGEGDESVTSLTESSSNDSSQSSVEPSRVQETSARRNSLPSSPSLSEQAQARQKDQTQNDDQHDENNEVGKKSSSSS